MSQVLSLELEKGRNLLDLTAKENQNIVTEVSQAFSNAVNNGVDLLALPENNKDIVKTEVKKIDWKEAGSKAVEAALRIGTKAIGINVSTFNNIKDIIEAFKKGDLKEGLSSAIDVGLDFMKQIPSDAKRLIKSSKDIILGLNFDNEFKTVMEKQKNTIDRLNKKCNKYEEAFQKNDEKEMSKQIKSIQNDLEKVMIIENTITRARGIVNSYELMKNKGSYDLTNIEKEVCQKI